MNLYVITDTDANGEDRTLIVAAPDADSAVIEWQVYYGMHDCDPEDIEDTVPERVFLLTLDDYARLKHPAAIGWHSDDLRQIGGRLSKP